MRDQTGTGVANDQETIQRPRERLLPADELRFIAEAQASPAAFGPLYRHYAPAIYRFCYRRLGHPDNAADATSQTFIKAIASLKSFRPDPAHPGKTFRAWLYHIAGNVVTDVRRAHRSHRSLDVPEEDASLARFLVDPRRSPEELAIAASDASAVRDALDHLPERQRGIVELRLAGLTGDEIAETMDMSLSAVKSAQFRAYNTLRAVLLPVVHDRGSSR